jgi:NitT/TauT family transport system substrate-binding protein
MFGQFRKFGIVLGVLFASLLLGSVGCSTEEAAKQEVTPKGGPPDKVVFNLNRLPTAYPVWWAALDKGFWAEQNLDVKIVRGNGSVDTVSKIATKQADFGISDIGSLILARAKEDIRVKAVANFQTYFSAAVIYNQARGINQPKDLEGKTIVSSPNSALRYFFPAFARAVGIDESKIQWKIVDMSLQQPVFVRGEADAWLQDIGTIPVLAKLGAPTQFFSYKDDGNLDSYGESIIVHEDTIKENPDLVRRFIIGYLKGVKYCLENPAEVGEIMKKYVPESDADLAVKTWQANIEHKVVVSEESREKGLGWMSQEKMARSIKLVLDAYNLQKEIASEMLYTTEFLPQEPVYPLKK